MTKQRMIKNTVILLATMLAAAGVGLLVVFLVGGRPAVNHLVSRVSSPIYAWALTAYHWFTAHEALSVALVLVVVALMLMMIGCCRSKSRSVSQKEDQVPHVRVQRLGGTYGAAHNKKHHGTKTRLKPTNQRGSEAEANQVQQIQSTAMRTNGVTSPAGDQTSGHTRNEEEVAQDAVNDGRDMDFWRIFSEIMDISGNDHSGGATGQPSQSSWSPWRGK